MRRVRRVSRSLDAIAIALWESLRIGTVGAVSASSPCISWNACLLCSQPETPKAAIWCSALTEERATGSGTKEAPSTTPPWQCWDSLGHEQENMRRMVGNALRPIVESIGHSSEPAKLSTSLSSLARACEARMTLSFLAFAASQFPLTSVEQSSWTTAHAADPNRSGVGSVQRDSIDHMRCHARVVCIANKFELRHACACGIQQQSTPRDPT
jgi:hypothetical protein